MKLQFLYGNRRRRRTEGLSLLELLVAAAAGLIILGAFVAITININTMIRSAGNYGDLDEYSRNTLDMLSRDVRNASAVGVSSTSYELVLTNMFSGTNVITYTWDGSNLLTRTYAPGDLQTNYSQVMLTNCDYLGFDYFIRVPTNDLQFIDITNAFSTNEIKLVSVSWRCSRSVLGIKLNTESIQTAQVVLRN